MVWIIGIVGVVVCWIATTVQRYFVFKRQMEYEEFKVEHGVFTSEDAYNMIGELGDMFEEEAKDEK
jgi:uncharacterized membrane protein YdbT with pleckstrin-like domain